MRHKRFKNWPKFTPLASVMLNQGQDMRHGNPSKAPSIPAKETPLCYLWKHVVWGHSLSGHCSWCHLVFKELVPQQPSRMDRPSFSWPGAGVAGPRSKFPCTQPGVPWKVPRVTVFSPLLHTSPVSFLCIMTEAQPWRAELSWAVSSLRALLSPPLIPPSSAIWHALLTSSQSAQNTSENPSSSPQHVHAPCLLCPLPPSTPGTGSPHTIHPTSQNPKVEVGGGGGGAAGPSSDCRHQALICKRKSRSCTEDIRRHGVFHQTLLCLISFWFPWHHLPPTTTPSFQPALGTAISWGPTLGAGPHLQNNEASGQIPTRLGNPASGLSPIRFLRPSQDPTPPRKKTPTRCERGWRCQGSIPKGASDCWALHSPFQNYKNVNSLPGTQEVLLGCATLCVLSLETDWICNRQKLVTNT